MHRSSALPRLAAWLAHASAVLGLALGAAGVLLVSVTPPESAYAQTRDFPANTRIGVLRMGNFPEATIDGRGVRFSPGARIHDRANLVAVPSTVVEPVRIRFLVDPQGQVSRAWILTDDEIEQAARQRSGR